MAANATSKLTMPAAAKDGGLSRAASSNGSIGPAPLQLPRSGASQLPEPLRNELSARFNQNLDAVRLHRGAPAEQGAEQFSAKAYTLGENIVMGASAPPLDTRAGQRVLAHEVTHVVQQRRGGPPPALTPDAAHERSADQAASAFTSGAASIEVGGGTGVGVARDQDDKKKKGKPESKSKAKQMSTANQLTTDAPTKESKKAPKPIPGVDPEVDADVERSIVEEDDPQPAPKNAKPAKRKSNKTAKEARKEFSKDRDKHANALSVGKGGQVHHGVEIQALKRYPGVFTKDELNDRSNMRGIKPENEGKRQLHNSKIREAWDRHYVQLDGLIKQNKLKAGSPEYKAFVRKYLLDARDEMDHNYGAFYSEKWAEQTGQVAQAPGGSKSKGAKKKSAAATGGAKTKTTGAAKKSAGAAKSKQPPGGAAQTKKASQKKAAPKKKSAVDSSKKASSGAGQKQSAKAPTAKTKKAPSGGATTKKTPPAAKKSAASAGGAQDTAKAPTSGAPTKTVKPAVKKKAITPPPSVKKPDVNKAPAVKADANKNPPTKPPTPTVNKSLTSKPNVSKPAVRTAFPSVKKPTGGGSHRMTSKPNARLTGPPGGPGRVGSTRPAFGARFRGSSGFKQAAASGLAAIAMPIINHYLQEHFADKVQEDAQRLISEAMEAKRGEFEQAIEARRQEIEAAQAEGKRVRLNVVVDTTWQDTTDPESGVNVYGSVLMNAKVAKFEILHEGEQPSPYTREKKGGLLGDLIRAGVGNEQTFERFDIELEGTNEEMRAFKGRMRDVEAAAGDPPVEFDELIIRSLHGDLSPASVREYAAWRREMASMASDVGVGPAMTAFWMKMESLMDGPLDELIGHAKQKGIALDKLRAYAVKQRDVAGMSNDAGAGANSVAYWSEVIELIDGH